MVWLPWVHKEAWVPTCQHAVLAFHFVGLTVASLVYHAKRSREWWRADVAFTMLSLLPFLAAEIMYKLDRPKQKLGCILIGFVYLVTITVFALAWRFEQTFQGGAQTTFRWITVAVVTLPCFILFGMRIRQNDKPGRWKVSLLALALGVLGLLLLIANLEKENNNEYWGPYFCPASWFSSLAVGHLLLAVAGALACLTYTEEKKGDKKTGGLVYALNKLVF